MQKKRNTITIKDSVIYWFRNEPKGIKKKSGIREEAKSREKERDRERLRERERAKEREIERWNGY